MLRSHHILALACLASAACESSLPRVHAHDRSVAVGASMSLAPHTLTPPPVIDAFAAPDGHDNPQALVDLRTESGAKLVSAVWRYSDVRIVDAQNRAVGADLRPSGAPLSTRDIEPQAGSKGFDDRAWPVVSPQSLEARRGHGKLSFGWYRLAFTLPERVGDTNILGSRVSFQVVVDDYAEVWVDGVLARTLGQRGGSVIAGFNTPNDVLVADRAIPGEHHTIAVFAMNGPVSASPRNFLWLRDATLEVRAPRPEQLGIVGRWSKRSAKLAQLIADDARVERVATGLQFAEGPVWNAADGTLLFSDPNANRIYRLAPESGLSVFRTHSGYSEADIGRYHQPGSNGLGIDTQGRLVAAEHGRRRITRTEPTGAITVLASDYEGKRLNSPNDLVIKSDGSVYFTDPPFGLPRVFDDPSKELPFSGIYRIHDGKVQLLDSSLSGPNGIAFSPDERTLYVTNWDEKHKTITAWDVKDDGSIDHPRVFFDMTQAKGKEALDGLEVDRAGNLYVSGPGGVWILSASGEHLGTLEVSELPANFAWGDADRKTLYMTARTSLYRLRTLIGASAP